MTEQNNINDSLENTKNTDNQQIVPHPLYTDFAEVMVQPTVTETSNFQLVLNEIPKHVAEADSLLSAYREDPHAFLESVDEVTLDAALKDMAKVTKFMSGINKSRKEMKSYLDGIRDEMLRALDDRLEGAEYKDLERAQADIKQLKKDVEADRREVRWGELKPTFDANIKRYPTLWEYAPELTDFDRFRMIHSKLVSGAKTRKIKEADHTLINETVYAWHTAIELIKENSWGLSPNDQNQLLTLFKRDPGVELVNREGRQLKVNADARAAARAEAEKREAEQRRAAELARERQRVEMERIREMEAAAKASRDQAASEQAARERAELEARAAEQARLERERMAAFNQQYAQFGQQYQTIFKESFPQFIKYLFENPNYHDVHSNPATKASVIYDIMRQVERPDSVVTKETAKSPQKVLDLVRYILDA